VVLATANSIDRSKEGMPATERLKQQKHQQQVGQMMPATTGAPKVLKIFFYMVKNVKREIFWIFFPNVPYCLQHCFICRP
jgi:hypothetical protein